MTSSSLFFFLTDSKASTFLPSSSLLLFFLHHVCLALSPSIQLPRGSHAFPLSPASHAVSLRSAALSAALLSCGFVLTWLCVPLRAGLDHSSTYYFFEIFELSTCPAIAIELDSPHLLPSIHRNSHERFLFLPRRARFRIHIYLGFFLVFRSSSWAPLYNVLHLFCALFCSLFKALRKILPLSCG